MFGLLRKLKVPPDEEALDNLLGGKKEEEQIFFLYDLARGDESAFARWSAAIAALQKT